MSNDFNLFILWANGRHKEQDILADIRQHFDVLQLFDITWSLSEFNRNLSRFYGKKLPNAVRKKKLCGTDRFLVICVNDPTPVFYEKKNMNMVTAKARCRDMLGGNFIHASDNQNEAEENLLLLTGLSFNEIRRSEETVNLCQDVAGAPSWLDEEQLMRFTRKLSNIGLNVSLSPKQIETPDIKLTCRLLNARKKFSLWKKNLYNIPVRGKTITCCMLQNA